MFDVWWVGTRNDLALVDAVEVAYRLTPDRETWLASVVEAAGPSLGGGAGVIGFFYDVNVPVRAWFDGGASYGLGASEMSFLRTLFADAERTDVGRIHRRLPIPDLPRFGRLSEFLDGPTRNAEEARSLVARLGVRDVVGVHVPIGEARGLLFNVFETDQRSVPKARVPTIAKLAAHLGAAARLRELGSGRTEAAVFRPDGRLFHVTDGQPAQARGLLGERVRKWLAARAGRATSQLDAWTPLVDGHWSIVERLERDGRRFIVVHENGPELRDPRALSARERAVVQLVALGDANKHIGYELGLPLGTVAHAIHNAARKLGVRTRADLVRHVRLLRAATVERMGTSLLVVSEPHRGASSDHLAVLSPAERAVVLLAAGGARSDAIAQARGTSVKTVSNQLAHAYAKLGARGRGDLARLVGGG